MRKYFYIFVITAFVGVVSGCAENQTRIGEGAGIGGLLGAGVGGIIGHQSGNDLTGVLIGSAVGAASGAMVGSQINKQPAGTKQSQTAGQLTIQQVVNLTKEGVSTDEIITKIQAASPKYSLTADDLDYMAKQGVSQRVIDVMQAYK